MPRRALSPEDIETFRSRAVEAAMRLFAERGYEGVSLRSVAAALGVSAMAPYRYFENKAEMFAMVRAEAYRRFADRLQAVPGEPDPLQHLWKLREAYLEHALSDPDGYRVMFALAQEPSEQYPALTVQSGRAFQLLVDAVNRAVDAGAVAGDPLTVAHLLWASTHGLVALHLAGKLTLGRTLEELWNAPPIVFKFPDPAP
jgi:AcrR family transcriptional regulator